MEHRLRGEHQSGAKVVACILYIDGPHDSCLRLQSLVAASCLSCVVLIMVAPSSIAGAPAPVLS